MTASLPHDLAKLALDTLRLLPGAAGPTLATVITLLEESGALDALAKAFRERIEAIDGLTAKVVE